MTTATIVKNIGNTALVIVLLALSIPLHVFVAILVIAAFDTTQFDDDDPRYQFLVQQFSEHRGPYGSGIPIPRTIDLAPLNNGQWTMACIFGGYNDPLEDIEKLQVKITPEDRRRLENAGSTALRLNQVEEYEIMVVYVDPSGYARIAHFRGGLGSGGQHLRSCISKPQTNIDL